MVYITECGATLNDRLECFPKEIENEHKWSKNIILNFSRIPKIDNLLKSDEYIYKDIIFLEQNFSLSEEELA